MPLIIPEDSRNYSGSHSEKMHVHSRNIAVLVPIQKREILEKVKEREDCNHRNT